MKTNKDFTQFIEEYEKRYRTFLKSIESVSGVLRSCLLSGFNTTYLNPAFYAAHSHPEQAYAVYEEDRYLGRGQRLIKDILEWMMTSEVHTQTGLSFDDILDLEFYTYQTLRIVYDKIEAPKKASLSSLQREITQSHKDLKTQQALLRTKNTRK